MINNCNWIVGLTKKIYFIESYKWYNYALNYTDIIWSDPIYIGQKAS